MSSTDCPNIERLLRLILVNRPLTEAEWVWLDGLRAHAEHCETCRELLTDLRLVTDVMPAATHAALAGRDPGLERLGHGDASPDDVPDDERLAAYGYLSAAQGSAAAAARWPATAAHVAACPQCQAELREYQEMLALVSTSETGDPPQDTSAALPALVTPPPTPPADPPPLPTPHRPDGPIALEPRTIRIGRSGMYIPGMTAPPSLRIAARGTGAISARPLEFIVDLRAPADAPGPWPRLRLNLLARSPGGAGCQMEMMQVQHADDAGNLLVAVPWRLEHETREGDFTPARTEGREQRGVTNAEGRASWYVTANGRYRLVVQIAGQTWWVPLHLTADLTSLSPQLRGAKTMPLAHLQVRLYDRKAAEQHFFFDIPAQPGHEYFVEHDRLVPANDRAAFERTLRTAAEALVRFSSQGAADQAAGEQSFTDLGAVSVGFLPQDIVAFLFDATTPLLIQTNDPSFPWEIVRHGDRFLGMHRPVGRLSPINRDVPRRPPQFPKAWSALIIDSPGADLSYTEQECAAVDKWLGKAARPIAGTPLSPERATLEAISRELSRQYDVLHFAGHVDILDDQFLVGGLQCAGGQHLFAKDIVAAGGGFGLVFLNGCVSGRVGQVTDPRAWQYSHAGPRMEGLAQAFLDLGARAVVCTLWPVADDRAYQFAAAFYEQLAQGASFGAALQLVRAAWRTKKELQHDPTWAAYVLYGDPTLTLEGLRQAAGSVSSDVPLVADRPVHFAVVDEAAHQARQRNDRLSVFLHRCVSDEPVAPDATATAILETTLRFVDDTEFDFAARIDLLIGLASVPGGMLPAALLEQGIHAQHLVEAVRAGIRHGEGRVKDPTTSSGFRAAIKRAAKHGDGVLTERSLVLALLEPPITGTMTDVFRKFHIDAPTLWAALQGERLTDTAEPGGDQPSAVRPDYLPPMLAADKAHDTQSVYRLSDMLTDLRKETRHLPPFIEREEELREALRTLTDGSDPHLLLVGPDGIGKTSMCWEVARRRVAQPTPAEVAGIHDWELFRCEIAAGPQGAGPWLVRQVEDMGKDPAIAKRWIVLLDDLHDLLNDRSLADALFHASNRPHIRFLATTTREGYAALRHDHPDLAQRFVVQQLMSPRFEVAKRMVEAALPMLRQSLKGVIIEASAVTAALDRGARSQHLALPGSALDLLRRAGARKLSRPPAAEVSPGTQGTLTDHTPRVTDADIAELDSPRTTK